MSILGIDWGDVGKNVFGGVHTAGKILASAFGAGALVAPVEQLESPALPDWARSTPGAPAGAAAAQVTAPDYVVLVHADASKKPDVVASPDAVAVVGGKRIPGNGYKHGDPPGKTFSFGYDAPARVDVLLKGKKATVTDVKQVLFMGGQEGKTTVSGDEKPDPKKVAEEILTDLARGAVVADVILGGDYDWRAIFYDPAGELYRTLTPSGNAYQVPQAAQNAYWAQQRAALATNPMLTAAQQRLAASQQQQAALRAQQAANTAALLQQARAQLPSAGMPTMATAPAATLPGGVVPTLPSAPVATLAVPDPNNPGFLTDGTPDPNYVASTAISGTERSNSMARNYLIGVDILGALARITPRVIPRAGFVLKTAPATGRKFLSLQVNRNAPHNPKKTIAAARQVAKRAQQSSSKALAAVKKLAKQTKVHGIGALAITRHVRPGARGPIRKLSPAALKQEAQKLAANAKTLTGTADKYEKSLAAAIARSRAGQKQAQQVTKIHGDGYTIGTGRFGGHFPDLGTHAPDFGTHVVGDDDFADAYWTEIVGEADAFDAACMGAACAAELVGGYSPPDPNHPGWLMDGSPDPAFGAPYGSDSGSSAPADGGGYGASSGDVGVPGPPDYGAGPVPTLQSAAPVAGLDFAPDPYPNGDDPTFYDCPTDDDLPLGAVVFDGSQQPPFQGLGNYTVFFGMLPGSGPPKGGPNSGYSYHGDDGWWLLLQGTQPSFNYSGGKNYDHVDNPNAAMVAESKKNNWGPLMGNPQGGWTHGLRFSPSGPNGPRWFWFFDTAMQVAPWAVQAILQARLNEAIVAYQAAVTAGQTDYVNQQIQDQLDAKTAADQARAQAAQDAQLQLQQQQQDAQEAAFEQQQMQQQAQLQLAQQQAELQYAQQQSAIDTTTDQAAAQYFAAHPELMFSEDQGGGDQGGGYAPPDYGAADQGGGDVENNVDWGTDTRDQIPEA